MFVRQIAAVAAFVGAAVAQTTSGLTITNPSPQSWWVSAAVNTLAWTCHTSPYSSYTVVLTNSNQSILSAPFALISQVPNYDCSYTVNQQVSSLTPSNTWMIQLANPLNLTDVYASTPFTIEAPGSAYPVSSAAPTSTAGGASATAASKTGAAVSNLAPFGLSVAAAMLGLVVA